MPDPDRDNFAAIRRHLQGVQRRRWCLRVAKSGVLIGVFLGICCLAGTFLVGSWADQPPAALRGTIWGASALVGALLVLGAIRALLWRQSLAQTARFVESRTPLAANRLINAVQLARDPDQPSETLVSAALAETARWCDTRHLAATVSPKPLRRRLIVLAVVAVAAVGSVLLFPGWSSRGITALLKPAGFVTRISHIDVLAITPGNATVFLGEPVTVDVHLAEPLPIGVDASILIPGQPPRPMHPADVADHLTCELGPAVESFAYAVQLGKDRYPLDAPYYELTVLSALELQAFSARCTSPAYLATPPGDLPDFAGDVAVPLGSTVALELMIHPAMASVVLEHEGVAPVLMTPSAAATYHATLDLAATRYRILAYDSAGRRVDQFPATDQNDGWFTIATVPDAPPAIVIASPGEHLVAPAGEPVPITLRAADDHGLAQISLHVAMGDGAFTSVDAAPLSGLTVAEHTFELPTDSKPADDDTVIRYYATVTDNREFPNHPPQTTRTAEHRITLQAADAFAAEKTQRLEQLRQHLLALLEHQARLRAQTQMCLTHHPSLAAVRQAGDELQAGQAELRQAILTLLNTFPFEGDTDVAQQVLTALADAEALLAVQQAGDLAAIAAYDTRAIPARALAGTQDTLLRRLEVLLGVMPSPETTTPQDTEKDPQTLAAEAKALLEEFASEQRRLIEATQAFGDKSIEDLTPEEQEQLEDLQNAQEDLHRLLDEAQARLDKLQAQDFSNPVALTELTAIRADVTMAAEALEELATEVATAAEENAASNAESLTVNLEKWLPDTPDRKQWVMEDLTDPPDMNAPELPDTLEDMIGDLLEEEEDLFDAMDDISSDATASLDEGAGWDAVDGPISSMNAQGVTGNQLPNSSDISGRSGEGRSGRAEGEFVEDQATGKGGRRTETRLTDEPFQPGSIDDTDDAPPGGATGGGKVSGAGAEGLEGPPPPEVQAQLDALAGQQALLTNRANALRVELQADDLSQFALTEAIILMNRVQKDLGDYNYQNALAQRDALVATLRNARGGPGVRLDFVQDSSAATPTSDMPIQAPEGDLPEAYRDHLEEYYRQLSRPTDSR